MNKNKFFRIAMVGSFLLFSGCAGYQRNDPQAGSENLALTPIQPPTAEEVEETISRYGEVPTVVNSDVMKWVSYFQGRGRRHMERYLERSSRYSKLMKTKLVDQGLPEDLIYVPLIESGFNYRAHSHASAVGYWQFIRGTATQYGLQVNRYVDERRDPVLSTEAAGRYFKALYNLFGDWYLALAAYNTGENRVKRMVMRYNTRDFWELARRRSLPAETRNYVPKFLAAMLIAKNPKRYGFQTLDYQDALVYDEIYVTRPISLMKLAKEIDVPFEQLARLNPRYRSDYVPIYRGSNSLVRIPTGKGPQAFAALDNSYSSRPLQKLQADYFYYRVRRGDTLSEIATRYRTRLSTLRRINGFGRRSFIRVGQRLRVPERGVRTVGSSDSNPQSTRSTPLKHHVVRNGENLTLIAQRYGISIAQLREYNGISHGSILRVGQQLKLVEPTQRTPQSSAFHIVRRGENLSLIAQKYGISVHRIKQLNDLGRGGLIRPGQKIRVNSIDAGSSGSRAKYHVVRKGDTLIHIAKRYDVSIRELASANELSNRSQIIVGRRLVIPE